MLLTELCFSQEAPQVLIAQSLAFDDAFCTYVTDKANDTSDIEERMALKSLVGIIGDVKKAIAEAEAADAAVVDAAAAAASPPPAADAAPAADAGPRESVDVFQEMRRMQGTMAGAELKPTARRRRRPRRVDQVAAPHVPALLARIATARGRGRDEPRGAVEAYHDMCDLQFVNLLNTGAARRRRRAALRRRRQGDQRDHRAPPRRRGDAAAGGDAARRGAEDAHEARPRAARRNDTALPSSCRSTCSRRRRRPARPPPT